MRTKAGNFRNAPKLNFDLYVISFICTNFEAFTTFSAIFTCIRFTSSRDMNFEVLIKRANFTLVFNSNQCLSHEINGNLLLL